MTAPLLQRFKSLRTLVAPVTSTVLSLNMLGSRDLRCEYLVTLWTLIQRIIQVPPGMFPQSLSWIDLNIAMATLKLPWWVHNTMFYNFVLIRGTIRTQFALEQFFQMHRMIMHISIIVCVKNLVTASTVIWLIIWMMRFHVNGQVSLSISFKVIDSAVWVTFYLSALLCYGRLDIHITNYLLRRIFMNRQVQRSLAQFAPYCSMSMW